MPGGRPDLPDGDRVVPSSACPRCTIEIEPVVILGESSGDEPLWLCVLNSRVAVDSRGRLYAIPCSRHTIHVFSPAGEYLESIGQHGEGPGEFQAIRDIWVDSRDVIHAFESRRHTAISPEGETLWARATRARPYSIAFLDGGHTVQSFLGDGALGRLPLHVLGPTGEVIRSFGSPVPTGDAEQRGHFVRRLAAAGDSAVWALHTVEYRLDLWRRDGTGVRTLTRDAAWFQELRTEESGRFRSLRRDQDGLLWTLAVMPDPDWTGPSITETPESALMTKKNEWDLRWDTWIEVIDPNTGAHLVTVQRDVMSEQWVGDLIYSFREMDNGGSAIDVWRLRLVRPDDAGE